MTKNEFEGRLDDIRMELFEKTKVMTNGDAAAAINDNSRRIAEKYGIAISKTEPVLPKVIP